VNVVKINNQTATLVENVIRKKERESRWTRLIVVWIVNSPPHSVSETSET
jgi:hypothetical protein